jgi:hypothetical protein
MAHGMNRGIFAALALAGLASAPLASLVPSFEYRANLPEEATQPARRRVKRASAPAATRKYRSRWKAERPKRRRNMNHVSKRTRRRHRRAAKCA